MVPPPKGFCVKCEGVGRFRPGGPACDHCKGTGKEPADCPIDRIREPLAAENMADACRPKQLIRTSPAPVTIEIKDGAPQIVEDKEQPRRGGFWMITSYTITGDLQGLTPPTFEVRGMWVYER